MYSIIDDIIQLLNSLDYPYENVIVREDDNTESMEFPLILVSEFSNEEAIKVDTLEYSSFVTYQIDILTRSMQKKVSNEVSEEASDELFVDTKVAKDLYKIIAENLQKKFVINRVNVTSPMKNINDNSVCQISITYNTYIDKFGNTFSNI